MTMRAIIVDDEIAAIKVLSSLLADYEDLELVGCYTDPEKALKHFSSDRPDVIFLDIEMGPMNGLVAAEFFNNQHFVPIVFVTAYSHYAIDAFEVNAIDYLMKPVQKKRLSRTMARLRDLTRETSDRESGEKGLYLVSLNHAQVTNEAGESLRWRTRKAKELFFYLWANRQHPVKKEVLLERIFPDKEVQKGLALLHTTVYQIRNSLADAGFPESVAYANESYQLQVPISSDLEELNRLLRQQTHDEPDVRAIMALYGGDFLAGEAYHWTNELRIKTRNVVQRFMEGIIRQELDKGQVSTYLIDCLDFLRRINPLDGPGVCLHLEFFAMQDKRAEMRDFYAAYRQRLARELKLKPPETVENVYLDLMGR